MESNRNTPFYLKKNKNRGKSLIIASIFLFVLALANPFFAVVGIILIVYGVMVLKRGRCELDVLLDEAIDLYYKKQVSMCLAKLERILELDKNNTKAIIMIALIKYSEQQYDETIKLLSCLPKNLITEDLDLQLNLADSYLKTKDNKNAEALYNEILKLQPKSQFIKDALQECGLENEEA